jgi:hypothetical protein
MLDYVLTVKALDRLGWATGNLQQLVQIRAMTDHKVNMLQILDANASAYARAKKRVVGGCWWLQSHHARLGGENFTVVFMLRPPTSRTISFFRALSGRSRCANSG